MPYELPRLQRFTVASLYPLELILSHDYSLHHARCRAVVRLLLDLHQTVFDELSDDLRTAIGPNVRGRLPSSSLSLLLILVQMPHPPGCLLHIRLCPLLSRLVQGADTGLMEVI